MEKEESGRTFGNPLKIIVIITLALLTLSLLWLIYDLYAYLRIKALSPDSETIIRVTAIGFLVRIILFLSFTVLMFRAFRAGLKPGLTVLISVTACTVAVIAMFFDFATLEDIGTDYLVDGYRCTGEWIWLFGSLIIRLTFYISLLLVILRVLNGTGGINPPLPGMVEEVLFEVTQWVGIVCGLTGVAFTTYAFVVLADFTAKSWLLWLLLFYTAVIIFPWLVLTVCRMVRLVSKRKPSSFDEKQKQDMAFAGMTAWFVSIPLMAVILAFSLGKDSSPVLFLWFPFYLFSTLLVFSATMLFKYRRG